MITHLADAALLFFAMLGALLAAAGILFLWARRRFRRFTAGLVAIVATQRRDLAGPGGAVLISRRTISTAMVRRRLRIDVGGALAAVDAAERRGASLGTLPELAAQLSSSSDELDRLLAELGATGATPVVLARAGELSISAHQMRRAAEAAAAEVAVPGHRRFVEAVRDEVRPLLVHPSLRRHDLAG